MKEKIKSVIRFIANPRLLLCLGIAWMITNGWSYVLLALGTLFQSSWMLAVSGSYLAFLWLPISPEKLVTLAIAIVLLRFLFPKDEQTLGKLKELHIKVMLKTIKRKKRKEIRKIRKLAENKENGGEDGDDPKDG